VQADRQNRTTTNNALIFITPPFKLVSLPQTKAENTALKMPALPGSTCAAYFCSAKAPASISLCLKALHSALRATFAQQLSLSLLSPSDALVQQACIRTQLHPRSSLQALHSSPGGLRLCSSAFDRWCKATVCIRSRLPFMQ